MRGLDSESLSGLSSSLVFWESIEHLSINKPPIIKNIIIDFPVAMVNDEIFLTYGKLPRSEIFKQAS